MKKTILFIFIVLIIIAGVLWWLDSRLEGGLMGYLTSSEENSTTTGAFGKFDPENPQETYPLEEVPEKAVQITISNDAFEPTEFTVQPEQVVSLAFEGKSEASHIIKFTDESLSNIRVVVGQYKRGISFVAPKEPGDYIFYCDVGDHRESGEEGVMHVINLVQ